MQVIDESQLQELASFESQTAPVLSLYLNTDLTQQPKEKCRLVLRELLERVRGSVSADDVARIERFFDQEYDWKARGVAIFSLAKEALWRTYPLAQPIASEVHTGTKVHLRPLSDFVDEYGRYAVVLVDREGARFFVVHLGRIEEKSEWFGEEVKRHKQGGASATRFQRRVDRQAGQNLRLAADATTRFCQENQCKRLVLAGSDETVAQFREMLPKALRKELVGTLGLDMEATVVEVRVRASELIRSVGQQRQQQLVTDLITATAKGGGAVTGVADTFYAAHEGRVHTLVVEKGFETEGYLCEGCGYLSPQQMAKCASCGGEPQRVTDAVNRIVGRVIEVGGKVEVVQGSEALAKAGHIGAVLRY
jgi:peptide chain release factor subunit 1